MAPSTRSGDKRKRDDESKPDTKDTKESVGKDSGGKTAAKEQPQEGDSKDHDAEANSKEEKKQDGQEEGAYPCHATYHAHY